MRKNSLINVLKTICKYKKINKDEVVFVVDVMKPRVAKIAYALRKKDYKVILIINSKCKERLSDTECFNKIHFFDENRYNQLYFLCLIYRPLVYHIFGEAYVKEWIEFLIKNKVELGKVVYDQYDVYRGFNSEEIDAFARREKYCLENADGLCCRMFETQYLKKKYGYSFKKRILFFDYCWNKYQCDDVNEEKKQGLIFVYGGRLLKCSIYASEKLISRYKGECSGLEFLAKVIQEMGGEFKIVPVVSCKEQGYGFYRNLKRRYENVQIYEPMSYKDLINLESKFDYGIDYIYLEKDLDGDAMLDEVYQIKRKQRYYATNKYFDYLDAGILPIYSTEYELFGTYLARIGGAVFCRLEELSQKINFLEENLIYNKRRAKEVRKRLAVTEQISRLIEFYNKL